MLVIRQIANVLFGRYAAGQKINYLRYALSGRKESLSYDPVTISVVATGRCTLSCDMCPTHSRLVPQDYRYRQQNLKDINIGMFKEIIDRYPNALEVHIIGSGEPLLNADLFKMIGYAAKKNMTVKTFTNGTELRSHIDDMLDSGLDGITISLNGHNAKEFSRMTGMGEEAYSRICDGIKTLIAEKQRRKAGMKVKLSFIIDRHNYKDIPRMIEAGIKLGADHLFFCNFLPSPYDGLAASQRTLTIEKGVIEELKAIFGSLSPQVKKKVTPPVLIDPKDRKNECKSHFSQVRVDGDGNVASCSMMLLNMTGCASFKDRDPWNSAFFRRMRKTFICGDDKELPEPCKACPENRGVNLWS